MARCLLECSEVSRVSRLSLDTDGIHQGQGTDEDSAYGVIWWTLAGRSTSWSGGDVAQEPLLPLIYWLETGKSHMQAHKHVGNITLRKSYRALPLPFSSARRHSTTPNTNVWWLRCFPILSCQIYAEFWGWFQVKSLLWRQGQRCDSLPSPPRTHSCDFWGG